MKSKVWFYLFWIQTIGLILILFLLVFIGCFNKYNYTEADLSRYISLSNAEHLTNDVVLDAKTAKVIGEAAIDKLLKEKGIYSDSISRISIQYDPNNGLWMIEKNAFLRAGGCAVIKQNTGEVIYIILEKGYF